MATKPKDLVKPVHDYDAASAEVDRLQALRDGLQSQISDISSQLETAKGARNDALAAIQAIAKDLATA